jgi:hypothetical protein
MQFAKIPSGIHSFSVKYNDGQRFSIFPMTVIGTFENGNTYLLKGTIVGQQVKFDILIYNDNVEGESVALDLNKLRGNDPGMLSQYIKYVLNPTMEEVGNTVVLENEGYILSYKPDMIYTLTDKNTGETSMGRRGFSMDFAMGSGKTFLLETDIESMSKDQFLASNYQEDSQIILIPVACTENEVTYRYEKPVDLEGTEITFFVK